MIAFLLWEATASGEFDSLHPLHRLIGTPPLDKAVAAACQARRTIRAQSSIGTNPGSPFAIALRYAGRSPMRCR